MWFCEFLRELELIERNLGCVNNTISHEACHWYRHHVYAAIKSILKGENFIACRLPD